MNRLIPFELFLRGRMKFFNRRKFIASLGFIVTAAFGGWRFFTMKKKKLAFVEKPKEQHWVGNGFFVHTMFHPVGNMYRYTTPFILMDYAPPKFFDGSGERRGVGEHPHRGFETVTFAFKGEVEHRDSSGGGGIIGTGDVQWMTAASGLVHDEFHSEKFSKEDGMFEMVQLWVNLPAKDKMSKPRYQGVMNDKFPRVPLDKGELKVFAGEYAGSKGPCETFTPINLYGIEATADCQIDLPLRDGTNTLILVMEGEVNFDGKNYDEKSLLVFEREGELIDLKTKTNARLLVLNGEPIDEPIFAHGPFVMNTKEEIIQAISDFQAGKMGTLN
jgi:redox-sensitive bicupin YhaK (pirin superfamily)